MRFAIAKLLSIIFIARVAAQLSFGRVNWCDPLLCEYDPGTHIACNNDGRFASTCRMPRMIVMTTDLQKAIMDKHNELRNKIASGNEMRFPTATRMSAFSWDNMLAKLAELNCKQCIMQHDKCRNTPYYMISGQNLGTEYSTKPFSTDKIFTFSVNRVQSWYDELAYMPPDIINSYQSQVLDDDDKGYGHAAAMLNERTNRIGCAVCQYKAIRSGRDFNATEIACNYASTNLIGAYVYIAGETASACKLGGDSSYKALCTKDEPVNPNEGVD